MAPNAKSRSVVYAMVVAIMAVGPLNFLLFRVMYDSFGASSAFFVSQGVNFLYVVIGGLVLYPKLWHLDGSPNYSLVNEEMRNLPQRRFLVMAALDCAGTFLAAMGAVHTPGQYQTLLNQSLIPFTMAASSVFLRVTYSRSQYLGALTILLGSLVAISPTFLDGGGGGPTTSAWASNCLYLASNVPMALSAVYKESRFAADDVHPLFLTQWVSIYQFVFGFVLMPLQLLPGVGSDAGMTHREIGQSFERGWRCWLQQPGACSAGAAGTAWLLPGYCAVNFAFNTLGLFLTSEGGASLNAISYSMLLPLATLSNALPLLGQFREDLQAPTLAGLVVVLLGFFAYEQDELRPSDRTATSGALSTESPEAALVCSGDGSSALAERAEKTAPAAASAATATAGGARLPTGLRRAASDGGDGASSSGSARNTQTPSFQERVVLVPLPTAGHAPRRPTARPALAAQQTAWPGQRRRQGYAAVDATAAAAVLQADEGRPSERKAARKATELV